MRLTRFFETKNGLREPLFISVLLSVGGVLSVIIAGYVNGVTIGLNQAIGMNAFFFCTRLLVLIPSRYCFKRWGK